MQQRTDKLTRWEEWAIFAAGAGSSYNILLYLLGYTLADATPAAAWWLWWPRVLFSICAFVGFELALSVTVMAMRAGRRSTWAWATVGATLLAAGGVALDVAGVVELPWLHAAPAVVLAAFLLHLAAPPVAHRASVLERKLVQAETETVQARHEVEQRDDELGRLRNAHETALAQIETLTEQGGVALAQTEARAAQAEQRAAQLERALRQIQAETERRQLEDGAVVLELAGARYSLRDAAARLEMAPSTLARKLKQEA